jgi:hypothetical protein
MWSVAARFRWRQSDCEVQRSVPMVSNHSHDRIGYESCSEIYVLFCGVTCYYEVYPPMMAMTSIPRCRFVFSHFQARTCRQKAATVTDNNDRRDDDDHRS